MFGCTLTFRQPCGFVPSTTRGASEDPGGIKQGVDDIEDDLFLLDDPPEMSPKLFRSDVQQQARDSPLPPIASLKPSVFHRKEPALHFLASARGDVEVLSEWLLAGGDPDAVDGDGWALLQHASVSRVCIPFVVVSTYDVYIAYIAYIIVFISMNSCGKAFGVARRRLTSKPSQRPASP